MGQLIPNVQRDIPYPRMSCSAIKSWGKKERRDVWSYGICLPKQPLCMMKSCFLGDG